MFSRLFFLASSGSESCVALCFRLSFHRFFGPRAQGQWNYGVCWRIFYGSIWRLNGWKNVVYQQKGETEADLVWRWREGERERAREQRSECATNRVAEPAILRRCDDMCMFLQDKRDGMYQVQQVLILRKSLGKWMVMFIEKGVQRRTLTQKANRPWLSSRDHDISRQVMFRCAWRMQQTPMTLHSGLWKNQTCIETPYLGCILDR